MISLSNRIPANWLCPADLSLRICLALSYCWLIIAFTSLSINQQYERAKQILKDKSAGHNQLAGILLEREIIYSDDLEKIFGKRPWISRSQEILENDKSSDEGLHLPPKPHGSGDHIFIDTDEKVKSGSKQENENSEDN